MAPAWWRFGFEAEKHGRGTVLLVSSSCARIQYMQYSKIQIKLFSITFFTVSIARQREECEIRTETTVITCKLFLCSAKNGILKRLQKHLHTRIVQTIAALLIWFNCKMNTRRKKLEATDYLSCMQIFHVCQLQRWQVVPPSLRHSPSGV